jgi:hypothetical protein
VRTLAFSVWLGTARALPTALELSWRSRSPRCGRRRGNKRGPQLGGVDGQTEARSQNAKLRQARSASCLSWRQRLKGDDV